MKQNNREIGNQYERVAADYLEKKGFQIIECNYRCKSGEIDIIAKEGDYIVFCEVKFRKNNRKGHALEAVDYRKQKKISKTALFYLTQNHMVNCPCRFDVIAVNESQIMHIEHGFEYQ